MKKIYVLLICTFHFFLAEAQSSKETITEYFDKSWKTTIDQTTASYYRTVESLDDKFIVRDYFISGKIQMIVFCSSVTPKMIKEGKSLYYYENDNIQEESTFKENNLTGLFKSFYKSGKPKTEVFYGDKKRYIHYYSEEGIDLLNHGQGLIHEISGDHTLYTEIEDSVAIASYYIQDRTMDTIYSMLEKQTEYRGGFEKMFQDVKSAIKYPKNARRNGITGTVFVQFIVDKKGKVRDCKIFKGIDPECDEEALHGAAQLPGWNPGFHKGKPVNTAFVLPVRFKL